MNITQQTVWRLTFLCGAILLLSIVGYSTYSIVRALRGTDRDQTAIPTPAPEAPPAASDVVDSKATPAIGAATPVHTQAPQVQSPQKESEFVVDYQTLREREIVRKETIETLRKIAKDNPESGYAMTEEQLRKFEKSGASFE
ncbi:MAG: hypothetical protein WC381_03385 [Kiritimatiellia bacterium]